MTARASAALDAVHAAGGTVVVVDGRLKLTASAPLPASVIEDLRSAKAEVLALLSASMPDPEDWRVAFNEFAAIAEFDGGLTRAEAEKAAFDDAVTRWVEMTVANSPEGMSRTSRRAAARHALERMGIAAPRGWTS